MKFALLVNKQTPDIEHVRKILVELGYQVLETKTADEIDQVGKQVSKVVLVFDDAKFAYKFCGVSAWGGDFDTLKILFLGRKPIMNQDVAQKISSVGLKLFSIGEEKPLKEKILQFENTNDNVLELDFSIISELEKEATKPEASNKEAGDRLNLAKKSQH